MDKIEIEVPPRIKLEGDQKHPFRLFDGPGSGDDEYITLRMTLHVRPECRVAWLEPGRIAAENIELVKAAFSGVGIVDGSNPVHVRMDKAWFLFYLSDAAQNLILSRRAKRRRAAAWTEYCRRQREAGGRQRAVKDRTRFLPDAFQVGLVFHAELERQITYWAERLGTLRDNARVKVNYSSQVEVRYKNRRRYIALDQAFFDQNPRIFAEIEDSRPRKQVRGIPADFMPELQREYQEAAAES